MMRGLKLVTAAVAVLLGAAVGEAAVYTGSLTYPGTGLTVSGQANGWLAGVTVSWKVSDEETGSPAGFDWFYEYTISVAKFAPRRLFVETGTDLTASDVTGVQLVHNNILETYSVSNVTYGTESAANNNGGMPSAAYGILFDQVGTGTASDEVVAISFYSSAAPGWGDLYTRCDGNGNRAYSDGFGVVDFDPSDPADSGSISYHVLTPLGAGAQVPEPGALLLLATVSGAMLLRQRTA